MHTKYQRIQAIILQVLCLPAFKFRKGSFIGSAHLCICHIHGILPHFVLMVCTLYTTLSPCPMCSGAIILYNIPRVVIGENTTLMGAENLLKCNDVEVVVLNDLRCRDLFLKFSANNPEIWDAELEKVGNTTEVK